MKNATENKITIDSFAGGAKVIFNNLEENVKSSRVTQSTTTTINNTLTTKTTAIQPVNQLISYNNTTTETISIIRSSFTDSSTAYTLFTI
jgi:hypothetical protein